MDNKEDPVINTIKNTENKSNPSIIDIAELNKIKWLTGC